MTDQTVRFTLDRGSSAAAICIDTLRTMMRDGDAAISKQELYILTGNAYQTMTPYSFVRRIFPYMSDDELDQAEACVIAYISTFYALFMAGKAERDSKAPGRIQKLFNKVFGR